jgi:hypothetical protein
MSALSRRTFVASGAASFAAPAILSAKEVPKAGMDLADHVS